MRNVVVVNRLSDFPATGSSGDVSPGYEVVEAARFLQSEGHSSSQFRIFNLCSDYRYCGRGYYVSLLAEARGQRPMPSVSTVMDLQSKSIVKLVGEQIGEQISRSLKPIKSEHFELSIYFGRNITEKYNALARLLFNQFRAPLLKAYFTRVGEEWQLRRVQLLSLREVPESHKEFLLEAMQKYFLKGATSKRPKSSRYDLAILFNPEEALPPSDERTIRAFAKAAEHLRMSVEVIGPKDIGLLPRFDALFIRETTNVNDHTFQFARRAEAEGLVVIDDPRSILRCCNKIYLHEALKRRGIATPQSQVISRGFHPKELQLSFPMVIKKPDSSFSAGVKKANNEEELMVLAGEFFKTTELLILQEFVPTGYDWRVGFIDHEPLYVCRYHMAKNHWQIIDRPEGGGEVEGEVDTIPISEAPPALIRTARKAADTIGDGLYGVDLKDVNGRFIVIEVNDNPSIEKGYEDRVAKEGLYERIMWSFLNRMEAR